VRWTGLSPEARKAERRVLLLDAGLELLGTGGSSATTVRALCQRTRLNPRYFYESFADLDALVVAVYDRVLEELAWQVIAGQAAAGDDPRDRLRAAVESSVGFVDEDRRRGRVLYVEALGNEALNRRRKEAGHMLVGLVEQAVAAEHGRTGASGTTARISAALLVGGMTELLVEWLEGRVEVTKEELVADATALLLALGEASAVISTGRRRSRRTPRG
jgi:AcrR family transcriptional regulator